MITTGEQLDGHCLHVYTFGCKLTARIVDVICVRCCALQSRPQDEFQLYTAKADNTTISAQIPETLNDFIYP
jgi:hypothetical protein